MHDLHFGCRPARTHLEVDLDHRGFGPLREGLLNPDDRLPLKDQLDQRYLRLFTDEHPAANEVLTDEPP